jgi:hypothetical protein
MTQNSATGRVHHSGSSSALSEGENLVGLLVALPVVQPVVPVSLDLASSTTSATSTTVPHGVPGDVPLSPARTLAHLNC